MKELLHTMAMFRHINKDEMESVAYKEELRLKAEAAAEKAGLSLEGEKKERAAIRSIIGGGYPRPNDNRLYSINEEKFLLAWAIAREAFYFGREAVYINFYKTVYDNAKGELTCVYKQGDFSYEKNFSVYELLWNDFFNEELSEVVRFYRACPERPTLAYIEKWRGEVSNLLVLIKAIEIYLAA